MRSSIEAKIHIILLLIAAIILISNIAMRLFVETPYINSLQAELAQKEVGRINNAITHHLDLLELNALTYSSFGDANAFISHENYNYVKTYFSPSTYKALDVDGVRVYNSSRRIVYGCDFNQEMLRCHDSYQVKFNTIIKHTIINNLKFNIDEARLSGQGILTIDGHQVAYGISAVVNKELDIYAPIGFVLFWQKVDDDLVEKWANNLEANLSLTSLTDIEKSMSADKEYIVVKDTIGNDIFSLIYVSDSHKHSSLQSTWYLSFFLNTLISIAALILGFKFIDKILIRPLQKLARNVGFIQKEGELKKLPEEERDVEISLITQEFNKLIAQIKIQQIDLEKKNNSLSKQSRQDYLTGLANRRRISFHCDEIWKKSLNNESPMIICMCDCDKFKEYNDNYGHDKGDQVLKMVGHLMKQTIKENDNILAGRYGGEEFVFIAYKVSLDEMKTYMERFQKAIEQENMEHLYSPFKRITFSIGIAQRKSSELSSIEELFSLSDSALYTAKSLGRNKIVVAE